MSILDNIMSNAWEDCVSGVSSLAAMFMAARTSGGRLVEVCVISSSRLPARNSISLPPQTYYFTLLSVEFRQPSFVARQVRVSKKSKGGAKKKELADGAGQSRLGGS